MMRERSQFNISSHNFVTIMKSLRTFRILSRSASSLALKYEKNGAPKVVCKLQTVDISDISNVGPTEVSLKILGAPINPSDLFQIEGQYGIQPPVPAIGGNEGVAVVEKVGSAVKGLKVGDWVVPWRQNGFGTWRQHAKTSEENLLKIANDIPMAYASALSVNPATAYRLLNDFATLKEGDCIIQNGANSQVGFAVVQMARERGIKTINIVRSDRPLVEREITILENLGGDVNLPSDLFMTQHFREILAEMPPVKLAFNCVGGETATDMARCLAPGGTLVTYGRMGGKNVNLPLEMVAEKQLKIKGFWMSEWYKKHTAAEASAMLNEIAGLIRDKKLSQFYELHDFDDFDYALAKATESFYNRKVVLNMDYPDRLAEHDAKDDSLYDMFDVFPNQYDSINALPPGVTPWEH